MADYHSTDIWSTAAAVINLNNDNSSIVTPVTFLQGFVKNHYVVDEDA